METDLPLRNHVFTCEHTRYDAEQKSNIPDCDNIAVTQLWGKLWICSHHLRALDARINVALAQIEEQEQEIN